MSTTQSTSSRTPNVLQMKIAMAFSPVSDSRKERATSLGRSPNVLTLDNYGWQPQNNETNFVNRNPYLGMCGLIGDSFDIEELTRVVRLSAASVGAVYR